MNLKKIYLALTSIILILLFFTGIITLNNLNNANSAKQFLSPDNNIETKDNNNLEAHTPKKEPFNAVILIGDESEANTDTMMVVNYNLSTSDMNILSIPRDTKIVLDNDKAVKINSIYAGKDGGIDSLIEHLNIILGTDIKYYVYSNIKTFREIIDLLGGVTIDVPIDLDWDDPIQDLHIHIKKGEQLMDGETAEKYLRFRHPNGGYTKEMLKYYDGSDLNRIQAQQGFINEMIKQKVNISYLPKLNNIVDTVFKDLETNITLSEIIKMIKTVNKFSFEKVEFNTLPGVSMESSPYYYLYDEAKIKELINVKFFK